MARKIFIGNHNTDGNKFNLDTAKEYVKKNIDALFNVVSSDAPLLSPLGRGDRKRSVGPPDFYYANSPPYGL